MGDLKPNNNFPAEPSAKKERRKAIAGLCVVFVFASACLFGWRAWSKSALTAEGEVIARGALMEIEAGRDIPAYLKNFPGWAFSERALKEGRIIISRDFGPFSETVSVEAEKGGVVRVTVYSRHQDLGN
ncbi:MAG TPA: hypothetical protein VG796_25330 [Verrucomicrobiales bacterium]|nr:hypothetical protein [Verrucomicrobiales bacterium]